MNPEIKELFETFKAIVEEQNNKIDALTGKLDEILGGAEAAYNDWDYKNRFNDFSERNKDTDFDSMSDKLKLIEGDDFDLKKRIFDDYEASDKSVEESEYVAGVIAHVAEQLEELKKAFTETTGEEVTEVNAYAEDGEPAEVEAKNDEGEHVAEATAEPEAPAAEEKSEEAPAEEEKVEEALAEEKTEEEAEPEDEKAAFIRELEEEKSRIDTKHIGA